MQHKNSISSDSLTEFQESEVHARAIERLAQELNLPVQEVQRSYSEVLNTLKRDATIKVFLPVLVSKCVKERLHRT